MLSCEFWADAWAIPKLEILINTKVIILSSEFYKKGEYSKLLIADIYSESNRRSRVILNLNIIYWLNIQAIIINLLIIRIEVYLDFMKYRIS